MDVREGIGVLVAIIVLAGLTVVVTNGGDTAKILQAGADGFTSMIRAATLQKTH